MEMLQNQLLTEGKAFTTLLRFSLPFLLANILQACYGASDLFMVGQFADSISVSAVATGGQIMQTITGLAIGLATGGTVLIGQYFGARRHYVVCCYVVAHFEYKRRFYLVGLRQTVREFFDVRSAHDFK